MAAAVACALYIGSAWWLADILPGGDEPHYLIITQSLLKDRDLQIENNHARGDYSEYFRGELPGRIFSAGERTGRFTRSTHRDCQR